MLNIPFLLKAPESSPRRVTGRNLAHAKRTPVQRALLAADIAAGRVTVVNLTLRQAAMLTGANSSYVAAAARLDEAERRAVDRGWRKLLAQPAPTTPRVPTLDLAWSATDHAKRITFALEHASELMAAVEEYTAPANA